MGKPIEITDKSAVLKAIHECDELGRDAFLAKYGYKRSTKYEVIHQGRRYDPKALVAAAYAYQFPKRPELTGFGGGVESNSVFTRLGFKVGRKGKGASSGSLIEAWKKFLADPIEQCRVKVRRKRAQEVQRLFREGDLRETPTFEREVWKLESETIVGDEDWTGWLFSDDLEPNDVEQLTAALDTGDAKLHGNYIWHEGSSTYYPQKGSTEAKRTQALLALEEILVNESTPPKTKVEKVTKLPGFGIGVASGLVMMFHPDQIALFNSASPGLAATVGEDVSDEDEYQTFADKLLAELGAEDFISLDWFLYQLKASGKSFPRLTDKPHSGASKAGSMDTRDDLNTILYGPPGTGKTYATAERAVKLIDGLVDPDRKALMKRFSELRTNEQIAMVTFHQSYSYEEFVEGIRPVLWSEQGESTEYRGESGVQYECRPGVFRSICDRANTLGASTKVTKDLNLTRTKIWKMSLGNTQIAEEESIFDDCIEHSRVALGYGRQINFAGQDSLEEVEAHFRAAAVDPPKDFEYRSVDKFKNRVSIGDLVIISDGNKKFRAIGRISGGYQFVKRDRYSQTKPVEWLYQAEDSRNRDLISRKDFSQVSLYELSPKILKLDALQALLSRKQSDPTKEQSTPHVLIIDEINRGNIAKILGELMTLLEPDKRLGRENELRVRLPYSGDEFGVPNNLHIIGTMNTADRSIAVLDTALRRRFHFEEMMPNIEVVRENVGTNGIVSKIDVSNLLEVLNQRIELLYDRDHVLGHAFLLKVTSLLDLRQVFVRKVIPLLQEYFYDDWERICEVLGCASSNNKHSLIQEVTLASESLLHNSADYEDKARYTVSTDFLRASEAGLFPYFQSILS